MIERKFVVPEGGLKAVDKAISEARHRRKKHYGDDELIAGTVRDITLASFIAWQSENPQVPTEDQVRLMKSDLRYRDGVDFDTLKLCAEWQRRMYLAPEPEVSECRQEVFSKGYGSTKAIVCSCGFATTYTVQSGDADVLGMEHFHKMHEYYRHKQQRYNW